MPLLSYLGILLTTFEYPWNSKGNWCFIEVTVLFLFDPSGGEMVLVSMDVPGSRCVCLCPVMAMWPVQGIWWGVICGVMEWMKVGHKCPY